MKNIILVGAGQIGSRHLQALANIKDLCRITVVDPNQTSLNRAQKRFLEVSNSCSNVLFTSILPTGKSFDLAVFATSADVRLAVFTSILQKNKLKHVIFEKVLFQSVAQIWQCTDLLEKNAIRAWVNCPRRAFTSYKKLKSLIRKDQLLSMKVSGSNYGLACNGIHFVDLFVFLSGQPEITIEQDLNCEVVESKRRGCFEVFGKLTATTNDAFLSICCDNTKGEMSFEIDIRTKKLRYLVDELAQTVLVYDSGGELLSTMEFIVPPQSQLSHIVASEIMSKGQCDLTTYSESALLHEQYLSVFSAHFNSLEPGRFDVCPIS